MLISWTVTAMQPIVERGEDLVLATVLSKSGSAPCLAGSKMIVLRDGTSIGTIGGGILEAEGQRRALETLNSGLSQIFTFDLSGRDAASMSMICGGRVTVFIELIEANSDNRTVIGALKEVLNNNERCFTVSDLGTPESDIRKISRCLVHQDGSFTGTFSHPHNWLPVLAERARRSTYPVLTTMEGRRFLVERCYTPSTVYIFGAGHVSQHLAKMAGDVSFQTVVLDDREEYANNKRFPTVDQVVVLESFENCMNNLDIDGDSYLVIVTRGHTHDRTILEQALKTKAGYIGMLGSKRKVMEVKKALLSQSFHEAELDRIHCPIGISIRAETTAEIAVSIVAELIVARATKGTTETNSYSRKNLRHFT